MVITTLCSSQNDKRLKKNNYIPLATVDFSCSSYSPEELHAMVDLKPEKKEDDWMKVNNYKDHLPQTINQTAAIAIYWCLKLMLYKYLFIKSTAILKKLANLKVIFQEKCFPHVEAIQMDDTFIWLYVIVSFLS